MMVIENGIQRETTPEEEAGFWADNPPEPTEIERLAAVEGALVELAGMIVGEGDGNG